MVLLETKSCGCNSTRPRPRESTRRPWSQSSSPQPCLLSFYPPKSSPSEPRAGHSERTKALLNLELQLTDSLCSTWYGLIPCSRFMHHASFPSPWSEEPCSWPLLLPPRPFWCPHKSVWDSDHLFESLFCLPNADCSSLASYQSLRKFPAWSAISCLFRLRPRPSFKRGSGRGVLHGLSVSRKLVPDPLRTVSKLWLFASIAQSFDKASLPCISSSVRPQPPVNLA